MFRVTTERIVLCLRAYEYNCQFPNLDMLLRFIPNVVQISAEEYQF
jgi:hypothetical protein